MTRPQKRTPLYRLLHLGTAGSLALFFSAAPPAYSQYVIELDDSGTRVKNARGEETGQKAQSQNPVQSLKDSSNELKSLGRLLSPAENDNGAQPKSGADKAVNTFEADIAEPSDPRQPEEPAFSSREEEPAPGQKSGQKKGQNAGSEKAWRIMGQVVFGDKRSMRGYIRIKHRILKLTHTRKGIKFNKTIYMKKVAAIEIAEYKSSRLRETTEGILYSFIPARVRFVYYDGTAFEIDHIPEDFKAFTFIHKKWGSSRFFTYFADLELKKGTWRERGDVKEPNNQPHPQTVTKILFAQN